MRRKTTVFYWLFAVIGLALVGLLAYVIFLYLPQKNKQDLTKFYYNDCKKEVEEKTAILLADRWRNECPKTMYHPSGESKDDCIERIFHEYVGQLGYDSNSFEKLTREEILLNICLDKRAGGIIDSSHKRNKGLVGITKEDLEKLKQFTDSSSAPVKFYIKILETPTDFLRIRLEPNSESVEIQRALTNDTYPVVEEIDDWYRIVLENGFGWVTKSYTQKI